MAVRDSRWDPRQVCYAWKPLCAHTLPHAMQGTHVGDPTWHYSMCAHVSMCILHALQCESDGAWMLQPGACG